MKIIERTYERTIEAGRDVVWWNYWDMEHFVFVHDSYVTNRALYEDEKSAVLELGFKIPLFSFMTSNSLTYMMLVDEDTHKVFNIGLFGILSITTIKVFKETDRRTRITMNYQFLLEGWRVLLAPLMGHMMGKWNERVWIEDVPLKLRRQKAIDVGFVDFVGLPKKISDRVPRDYRFKVPMRRPKDSPVNEHLNKFDLKSRFK